MASYRILSFDGGGVRGLLSIGLLQGLEERVPGWLDAADLLAGTSTGGVIALGLAKGMSPAELRDLYYRESPIIFGDSMLDDVVDIGRLAGAEYSGEPLRRQAEETFGRTRLQDLDRRVLVAAFDLDNEAPDPRRRCWKPKFFHNFPGSDTDGARRAAEVATYTTAAPTYFPSVDGYIDGGVVANNPSMAALAQVLDERAEIPDRPSFEEIRLLSIGTGSPARRLEGADLDWGYLRWARPLIRLMLDGVVGVPDFQCRQLLGGRYARLEHRFAPGENIELDDWEARDRLLDIADNDMERDLDRVAEWLQGTWM